MKIVIILVLCLYLLQLFLQETTRYKFSLKLILGNRDNKPEPTVVAARLDRAKNNMMEALPIFLGLCLLVLNKGGENPMALQGAWIFFFGRLFYVPLYAAGIQVVRSVAWLIALGGMIMMGVSLFG